MSDITANLVGVRRARVGSRNSTKLARISDRLTACYGAPRLGNYRDPIKEIFYILLSARTTERLYKQAHRSLWSRYPGIDSLSRARVSGVKKCVAIAGLGSKRANQVVSIAKRIVSDFGTNPVRRLRQMPPEEVYRYLTSLPGIGPKSALCILMCSFDQDVFPVDINVQRVLERVGIVPKGLKHYEAQRLVPRYAPNGKCFNLHVGLVEHGRRVCVPGTPKCSSCVLLDLCAFGIRKVKSR